MPPDARNDPSRDPTPRSEQEARVMGAPAGREAEGRAVPARPEKTGAARVFETRQNPYGQPREEPLEELPDAERPRAAGAALGSGFVIAVIAILAIAILPFFLVSVVIAAPIAAVVAIAAGVWAWSRRGKARGT